MLYYLVVMFLQEFGTLFGVLGEHVLTSHNKETKEKREEEREGEAGTLKVAKASAATSKVESCT